MKTIKVADLMVPLSEYATVSDDASLYDAVMALEKSQEKYTYTHSQYRHRAILVLDKSKKVIGKIAEINGFDLFGIDSLIHRRQHLEIGFRKKILRVSVLKQS